MSTPTSLRKAAILVAGLEREAADAVLRQLPDTDAALVRAALLDLDSFDQHEQDEVITDFLQCEGERLPPAQAPPVDDDPPVILELTGAAGQDGAADSPAPAAAETQTTLDDLPLATLVRFLHREHPQTVAVVLSRLSPQRAAQVIMGLPPVLTSDVIRRLVELDGGREDVGQEVEYLLQRMLADQTDSAGQRSPGIVAASRIVSAAESSHRDDILQHLAEVDIALARQLGYDAASRTSPGQSNTSDVASTLSASLPCDDRPEHMAAGDRTPNDPAAATCHESAALISDSDHLDFDALKFDSLSRSDQALLAGVVSQSPELAATALAGATSSQKSTLLARLPVDVAKQLGRSLECLGPVRIDDIQSAQHQLVGLLADGRRRHHDG